MTLWQAVMAFVAGAAVLTVAGTRLARAGDELAERTGLGRLVIGMLLSALATTLPELVTDVSAASAGSPDLAVGDLFGSSMANMAILALIDLTHRGKVWLNVELGHARVASVAIGITALASMALLTPRGGAIGWVGVDTLLIAGAYIAAVAWIRRSPLGRAGEAQVLPVPVGFTRGDRGPLAPTLIRLGVATALVLASAPVVALAGRDIADSTGIGETFVGTVLLAISTSLPELVTSIAAVRIGAHDLAVGNLFGSNALNMALLVFVDGAYRPGPLLAAVDPAQAVAAVGAILLMGLALAAIVHGAETRIRRLEPDAIVLLLAYCGALFAVWSVHA